MSSLDRVSLRLTFVAVLALALAGCFRPLYGPTASGERIDAVMAAIEVEPIASAAAHERLTHYLRSELVFDLNGSGTQAQKRYKLSLAYAQRLQSPIVDTSTGRAQSANVIGEATYTLTTWDGERTLTSGKVTGFVTYDRNSQRFATIRASRDADIRLAEMLAEQIKTRIAAALAGQS
jgi:LPS-assembly lipoprotein